MTIFSTRQEGIDARTAKDLVDQDAVCMLDVREIEEWTAGHIPDAVHVPLGTLEQRRHELPREAHIIAVCRSGVRSDIATEMLTRAGYRVENLRGGMHAWAANGYPMEPPDGYVA